MSDTDVDVVVVGAGFAGLYMLHRLRQARAVGAGCIEAGGGVGGTWYWNRYPGRALRRREPRVLLQLRRRARSRSGSGPSATPASPRSCATSNTSPTASTCGATSASTPAVSRRDVRRGHRAGGRVRTDDGDDGRRAVPDHGDGLPVVGQHARHRRASTRSRATRSTPAGGRTRASTSPASGSASIGTGSSGIQAIPVIAEQADQLVVFQRTPSYSVPARNAPLDPERAGRGEGRLRGAPGAQPR